ncbi:MAG: tetratricopeptide repeat protein [Gammaproteobacteria bacterium]
MMKFFAWLAVCFLAAGISTGVVAGDAEDCKNYYFAEDYKRAFPACSRAAKQGDASAQFHLGLMYANGESVPKNEREAAYRFAETDFSCGFFGSAPVFEMTKERKIEFVRMELFSLDEFWTSESPNISSLYVQLPKQLVGNQDLKVEINWTDHNQKSQSSSYKLKESTQFKNKENLFSISLDFYKKYLSQITSYQGQIVFRLKNKSKTLCKHKMEIGSNP